MTSLAAEKPENSNNNTKARLLFFILMPLQQLTFPDFAFNLTIEGVLKSESEKYKQVITDILPQPEIKTLIANKRAIATVLY